MSCLRTEAILLRAIDFGESDRILHLLVPESGRLTAIAKGARRSVRRFAGTLDLFNHLRVSLDRRRNGAMARLDQATLLRSFTPLRCEPARFALGCYLLELLDRLAPEGGARAESERLFAFSLRALGAVAERPPDARLRLFLELRALDLLGLRPELSRCVRCGAELAGPDSPRSPRAQGPPSRSAGTQAASARSEAKPSEVRSGRAAPGPGTARIGFHVADGGPLCAACALRQPDLLEIHRGTLRALELLLRLDPERIERLALPRASLDEARELLQRFQRFHLGVELRSQAFLDSLLPRARHPQSPYTAASTPGPP